MKGAISILTLADKGAQEVRSLFLVVPNTACYPPRFLLDSPEKGPSSFKGSQRQFKDHTAGARNGVGHQGQTLGLWTFSTAFAKSNSPPTAAADITQARYKFRIQIPRQQGPNFLFQPSYLFHGMSGSPCLLHA